MARGVHLFDLARFLTGAEVDNVSAYTDATDNSQVDQLAVGWLGLGDIAATLVTSRRLPLSDNRVVVYGERGQCTVRAFTTDGTGTLELFGQTKRAWAVRRRGNVYATEIDDFSRRLGGHDTPSASGLDGLASMAITRAFQTSARTGRTISVKRD